MKVFVKILISVLYTLVLFFVTAGLTTEYVKSVNSSSYTLASRLTMAVLFVLLPIFYYAVWNKAPLKVKVIQWAVGTVTALILRFAVSIATDIIFINTFDLLTVSYIRTGAGVGIILATIWLARRIDAKLSPAA